MPDQQPEAPAEETAETAAPAAAAETPKEDEAPEQPKPTETVEFWKAKAREQEKRAKENAAKAAEFDKVTEAQKSEQQRLLERAEAAEGALGAVKAAQEINDWKAQVSKQTGVPVDVLRGTDLEEIEAHAASLKALLPEPRKPGSVPGKWQSIHPRLANTARNAAPPDHYWSDLRQGRRAVRRHVVGSPCSAVCVRPDGDPRPDGRPGR
jgi:hypothetical protein